jgi:hypothetical protein
MAMIISNIVRGNVQIEFNYTLDFRLTRAFLRVVIAREFQPEN